MRPAILSIKYTWYTRCYVKMHSMFRCGTDQKRKSFVIFGLSR